MAVALDSYAPFDDGAGATVTEGVWRSFMRLTVDSGRRTGNGVIRGSNNELLVYADSSGSQVKVKTGEVWSNGMWGSNFAEKTLPIANGHATLARIDAVVVRIDQTDNIVELDVVQGTPDASPVAPTLTETNAINEIQLARVSVPALDTVIAANQVFDGRRFQDWPEPYMMCSTNTVVNNSATLVDVTGMSMLASHTAHHQLEGYIEYDAATAADIKIFFTGPTGTFGQILATGLDTGTAGAAGNLNSTSVTIGTAIPLGGAGVGTRLGAHLSGWVQTPEVQASSDPLTNPFKLKLQFAQNTANGSNATLYANSWIRLTRSAF